MGAGLAQTCVVQTNANAKMRRISISTMKWARMWMREPSIGSGNGRGSQARAREIGSQG